MNQYHRANHYKISYLDPFPKKKTIREPLSPWLIIGGFIIAVGLLDAWIGG